MNWKPIAWTAGGIGGLLTLWWAGKLTGVIPSNPRSTVLALPTTKREFVQRMMQALGNVSLTSAKMHPLITAHAAYESNWGKAFAARQANNVWNLTDGQVVGGKEQRVGRWKGAVIVGNDVAYAPGSAGATSIKQLFNSYPTLETATADYISFLRDNPRRYADAWAKLNAGDETFVIDLGVFTRDSGGKIVRAWPNNPNKGGFYTLPIPQYFAEFKTRLVEVNSILTGPALLA